MTSEQRIKTCCVIKCINTSSNSKVNFFCFPRVRQRRNRWVQAIRNENGRWWVPSDHSLICSDHFVNGKMSNNARHTNYAPSVFTNTRTAESIKSRAVSVKKFALEYIKHDALLEKPTRSNVTNDLRKCAYVKLAAALGIPVCMVRGWERRFRVYFEEKMAEPPDKRKQSADGQPHWLTTVAERLCANPMHRLPRSTWAPVSPGGVVSALCAAARARGTLCSTALYNDVRRVLRLSSAVNDLHAVWVSAQRVSLQQVLAAGRAGDAPHAAPPPAAAAVADLVLLHTDVDIVTDESVTLYEESAALHTLWQLIQRHRLEDAAPAHSRVRAQRWTRAHRTYLDSGRTVSLVVLQRRWYELKLQARVRLAMHWRRPPGPQIFDDPTPAPHDPTPRPAPLHIAILKRYPHIATGHFMTWRQQVLQGTIVTDPLEEENDVKETQSNNNKQSTGKTDTDNDAADKQLYPNTSKVEQPTFDEPKVEQPPDNEPLTDGPMDTDLLEEENDVSELKSNVNRQLTDTGDDAVVKQLYPNMSKVEQPTGDEPENEQTFYNVPLVGQSTSDDQLAEHTTDNDSMAEEPANHEPKNEQSSYNVEQNTVDDQLTEHTANNDPLAEEPTVHEPLNEQSSYNVEQNIVDDQLTEHTADNDPLAEEPTVHEPQNEQSSYNVEQNTVGDQLTEHTAEYDPLAEEPTVHEPEVEQPIDSGSLSDNHVSEQTTDSGLLFVQRMVDDPLPEQTTDIDLLAVQSTVDEPKIEQGTDLLINQSTVWSLAESPVGHAGNAATADIPDMLDTPDTQGGPDISSKQIHRAEEKSNEVIPLKRAYSSDPDTDTEDNLVIDECSNNTPSSLKREPVPPTETHSFDTVSPHAALGNIAPTIEVLHMIDPNTVKTEILFESDEDDFQPCNKVDNDEIEMDVKKEVSFISNRIMFADEEPVSCDVKSEDDVTGRMDWEDGQIMDDPVNDTQTMDPKLLMNTQVPLFRIDKTRAWKNNVRKDKSIRFSRIHRRYYTPKPKNKCNNTKTCTQNTRVELQTSAHLTTTTTSITDTQEIRVDESCLDKVASTHSIRQLCRNIKRELIEEQLELLEGKTPNKKAKTESDTDDEKPLLELREGKPPRETTDETEDTVVREMVEESSSDDELLNEEMFSNLREEERKRGPRGAYAASTIEWSAAFVPALGRVAKRVSLPDIEQVRRYNSGMRVAQVAPITTTEPTCGNDAMQAGQPPGDAVADVTPEAWRKLELPVGDELQAVLDDLTTAPAAEAVLERSHCCTARRHREVNDTRRRIGLAEIPLHNHPDGVCTCCCTHLSDADARQRLDQQLRALHEDIEQMLRKSAGGKIQSKPVQKHPQSPSPAEASTSAITVIMATAATSTHKQATKVVAPSNTVAVAKGSKAKPATYTNTSKKRRRRARAPPAPSPSPPAPPISDYEEWQRQKNMNAKYFHINSNISFKKDKSTTVQGTAKKSIAAQGTAKKSTAVQRTTAQATGVQRTIAQSTAAQSTTAQGHAVQSTTVQGTAVQSTTAQGTAAQSTTAQGRAVQNITAQGTAVQSTTAQTTAAQNTTAQGRAVQSTTAQGTAAQSTTAQGTAVQSTTAQATAAQNTTAQGRAVQSTTAQATAVLVQTFTKQNTITQSTSPQQNLLRPGLMPYIRQSRLVTPLEEPPRAKRAKRVPPLHGTKLVNIAPKLAEHAQHNIVVDEPATLTEGSKNLTIPITNGYQSLAAAPRRMNLTTEQVPKPNSQPVQPVPEQFKRVNSAPIEKPMSILEEYSRTLSTEPVSNTPVVNALSLRVPSGPQGPKTTILMALTLPSDDVIKQTINRLYANETVDLTEEPVASTSVIAKTDSKQKTPNPIDLVRAFKNLMNPVNKNSGGRSLLKTLTATQSGKSLLKTTITHALDKPPNVTKPTATVPTRDTSPNIMSLSNQLHDGDVIEIDDTDSNHSNSSDGNQSCQSNKSSNLTNKSSNLAVCTNTCSNQATKTDESSNQAASNSREAVSNTNNSHGTVNKTNERSSQAITTNNSNQAIEDKNKNSNKANRKNSSNQATEYKDKRIRDSKERWKNRSAKPTVFKKGNVSVEAVRWHSPSRPCSSIPVLTSLTDGSRRCPARFANVAAMTDFMATLRRAAAQADKEVYCHKWSAVEQPVSALPCGGTLLCVDGSRPPLVLPALGRRDQPDRASPHARAHLVLTDADPPCALPTYWTLAAFGQMARVIPDELLSTDEPDESDAPDAADAEPRGGARWSAARGEWVTPKEDRKICEKNHNFKILTAFCSADGIRQAARAGASLLLLSVLRARVAVLALSRHVLHGAVRHRASADVEVELLRELEALLDEAEVDEILGGRADVIGQ